MLSLKDLRVRIRSVKSTQKITAAMKVVAASRLRRAQEAAEAMKVTAQDLKKLDVIDDVIPEPMGGAHRSPDEAIDAVGKVVVQAFGELSQFDPDTLRRRRQDKFLAMGKKGL